MSNHEKSGRRMHRLRRKAEMGMGTLIIFIAMILVAAIAASVLISTTGNLQNKALATGKATTQEVGTSIQVVRIYAENGTAQTVDYFYQSVKLSSGSDPVRLADMLMTVGLNNVSQDYGYSASVDCDDISTMSAGGDFGMKYQITGTNNKSGYVTKGDVIQLCWQSPRKVREGEDIKVTIVPMVGIPVVTESSAPELMIAKRIHIFP